MGKKSDPPPAPDYAAAAEQTAQGSREAVSAQTRANRADQYSPWGSSEWTSESVWNPSTGRYEDNWKQDISLSPSEQVAFDAQQGVKAGRSLQALDMLGRMQNEFGQPMDWSNFQKGGDRIEGRDLQSSVGESSDVARLKAEDAIYNKGASRLDDRFSRDQSDLEARLLNQGLRPGDEAYKRAMTEFGEGKTDAYDQLSMSSILGGGQEMQRNFGQDLQRGQFANNAANMGQGMDVQRGGYNTQLRQQEIAEELQRRGFSLNEMQAILSGQQVNMPGMPSFAQSGQAQGPNMMGAANAQHSANMDVWNAGQAQDQAMMNNLTGLAGGAMMMSDRRMKKNIHKIGSTPGGTNIYSFEYAWSPVKHVGVMADEVPHAAVRYNGVAFVDYSKVN